MRWFASHKRSHKPNPITLNHNFRHNEGQVTRGGRISGPVFSTVATGETVSSEASVLSSSRQLQQLQPRIWFFIPHPPSLPVTCWLYFFHNYSDLAKGPCIIFSCGGLGYFEQAWWSDVDIFGVSVTPKLDDKELVFITTPPLTCVLHNLANREKCRADRRRDRLKKNGLNMEWPKMKVLDFRFVLRECDMQTVCRNFSVIMSFFLAS